MKQTALVLLMACVLTACTGTVTMQPVERGAEPVFDSETHGVVVASSAMAGYYQGELSVFPGTGVGSEYFRCQGYSLLYQRVGEDAKKFVGDLVAIPDLSRNRKASDPYDYEVPDGVGYVQATVVPAGNYEFWYRSIYCGTTNYYAHDFLVPFTVEAGKANYLGEVRYLHQFGRSPLGNARYEGSLLRVVDELERDLPLLHDQYPFLRDLETVRTEVDWSRLLVPVE